MDGLLRVHQPMMWSTEQILCFRMHQEQQAGVSKEATSAALYSALGAVWGSSLTLRGKGPASCCFLMSAQDPWGRAVPAH